MSDQLEHAAQAKSPRTHRTQLIVGLTVVVALVAGIGLGVGLRSDPKVSTAATPEAKAPAETVAETMPSFLYVVDGKTGSTKRTGADTWRLTLTGPTVLWFANRPSTGSGDQSAASLVKQWPQTFAGSPPNAAVLAPDGPAGHHPTAVKLTAPSFDKTAGTVSFTLTSEKHQSAAVSAWLDELTPGTEAQNGRVVLFVDDALPSALPPGTYQYVSPPKSATITFSLAGAQGGNGGSNSAAGYPVYGGPGGPGGEVTASIVAPANTVFQLVVGAAGGVTQGGGASAVYSGACAATLSCGPSDRVLVAGGGGGGGAPTGYGTSSQGYGGAGSGGTGGAGGAGYTASDGSGDIINTAGGGGSPSGGGGGGSGYGGNGGQGGFDSGGTGGSEGGGYGGGGYYGGGGGGGQSQCCNIPAGGGGGGSGYVDPSLTQIASDTGSQPGDGAAVISSVSLGIDLSSSANPALPLQAVTYTATVSPAPPGGNITFNDGGAAIDGCSGLGVSTSVTSVSCPVSYPTVGSHTITAMYSGDAPIPAASSSPLTQTVNPVAKTSTSLASSLDSAGAGESITYTATVTPAPDSGTVAFTADGTAISGCEAAGLDAGVATCETAFAAPGTYTVAAAYSGSGTYPASSSTTLKETVSEGVTTTALSSSANPSIAGQQLTFTATVSPVPDGGTINFTSDGTTMRGCGAVVLNAGVAQCTTFYPGAGSHDIGAAYSGDTNYAASTPPSFTQTVAGSPFG